MAEDSQSRTRLARAWDEAAEGYETYFVPRFAPWVELAVAAVTDGEIPEGPILVPCCGTFPEAELLVERFGDREIVGIDLSAGMVARARERTARWPNVEVIAADAATLDTHWSGRCGAVMSAFGLQQLPDPGLAVRSWLDALRRGGRLSIVFWPEVTEHQGPFALMSSIMSPRRSASGEDSWQERLAGMVTRHGAILERDELPTYPMTHVNAPTFFDAYTRSGPARNLALARGDEFMDMLRDEFLRKAPSGEWTHNPRARLIVAHR